MKINLSKTVQENFLDLIHEANPGTTATVTTDKVTFGEVTPSGDPNLNSQVTVNARPNRGYSQSVVIKFHRLGMSSGVKPLPSAIQIFPSDTPAQRKTKVAAALGLMESEITVTGVGGGVIGTPENEDDTSVSVVVTPISTSALYTGDPLTIKLTVPDTDIPLNQVITVTTMNGFEPVS